MARKKKKTPKKFNMNSTVRSAIRRTFSRSPIVKKVKDAVRSEHDQYKKDGSLAKRKAVRFTCAICGRLMKGTEVQVDHIEEVIPKEGFTTWDDFVERLYTTEDNLQVLCSYKLKDKEKHGDVPSCHHVKTQAERKRRREASAK